MVYKKETNQINNSENSTKSLNQQKSADEFQGILNSLLTTIEHLTYIRDKNLHFIFVSSRLVKIIGKTAAELNKLTEDELISIDLYRVFFQNDNKVLAGERVQYEHYLTIGERTILLKTTKIPLINGQEIIGMCSFSIDITHQRTIIDKLDESKKKIRQLEDLIPLTLFEIDLNGRITYFNNIGLETFLYTATDIQKGLLIKDILKVEQYKKLMIQINKLIEKNKLPETELPDNKIELELRRKDGKYIPALIISKVIKKDNKVTGFRGVIMDMTELKKLEEDLKNFAFIVSHDLKSPLRAIATLSKWISEEYKDKLDERGERMLEMLESRVKRMDALIDDILQYSLASRIKKGTTSVDLNETILTIIDLLTPPPDIKIIIEKKLPVIEYDKTAARLLIQNLISNGIKYSDPRKSSKYIIIDYEDYDKYWLFSIKDNGIGIDFQYCESIFELFQTAPPIIETEYDSTGVGLAVVKKIVENHGGKVWVDSKVGEGSTFYFTVLKNSKSKTFFE